MTVLGGGYIALEFGGIFQRFGSATHVVYRAPLPLRGFDEEVRAFAAEQYAATGLALHAGKNPVAVEKRGDGKLAVVLRDAATGETSEIAGNDAVMMATGRHPKVSGLGLDAVGVKLGRKGEIVVDEYSRTNVPSVWAVGDVTDRFAPVTLPF